MAQTAIISQLKFRVTSLESQLADKQRQIEEYQTIQSEADSKIKAISKMHADKVKTLLNSIQILKKQKASIQGLSKQHKRSKLIEQLNKEIGDQDIVIEVLRKYIYDKDGREQGRSACDEIIVKALTKGPDRVRPLSREQLRMQIDRMKSININLQSKLKNGNSGNRGKQGGTQKIKDDISDVSSVQEQSFINHNQDILKKMKQIQLQNENMKLQANAKLKIIQKLKLDLREKDKLKAELQIITNENEVTNHKLKTFEKLMKESKQNTNAKIIELYEREVKVQQLQMVSKHNSDQLEHVKQSHNILQTRIKEEKEELQTEIDSLKNQNEQLILENISAKKKMQELKEVLKEVDDLNQKRKQDLKGNLQQSQQNIAAIVAENNKYKEAYHNIQSTLFKERADWVQQKAKLIQELRQKREGAASKQLIGKYMQDIAQLRQENHRLKEMLQAGGGTGGDEVLLQRLKNYERKLQFYEKKGDKQAQKNYYDELFKNYNDLAQQFQQYKLKYGDKDKKKLGRRHFIQINKKQESQYDNMSSGISRLNLSQIESDLLDNFDSSYDYEIIVNEFGKQVKVPRITQADKELLKLITSDLWNFVKEDKIGPKIKQAGQQSQFVDQIQIQSRNVDYNKVRNIKNLTNPRGQRVVIYEEEVAKLDQMSEGVSVTSAMEKQLNKFDSDVDIQMRRFPIGTSNQINPYKMDELSFSVSNGSSVPSSVKDGQSDIVKRKKKRVEDKGSRLQIKKGGQSDMDVRSEISSSLLDSDVSSLNINKSQFDRMDSDIEGGLFKKKKK